MNVKSHQWRILALGVALCCLELWGDLKGSLPLLGPTQEVLASVIEANGRLLALSGILLVGSVAALCPRWLERRRAVIDGFVGLLAVAGSLIMAGVFWAPAAVPTAIATATVLSGCAYGWYIIEILCTLSASDLPVARQMLVIVAALVAKWILIPIIGGCEVAVQAFVFIALPLVVGFLLMSPRLRNMPIVVTASREGGNRRREGSLVGLLVLFPVLNAVVRSFGTLGQWGGSSTVTAEYILVSILSMAALAVMAYAVFSRCSEQDSLSAIIRALVALLAGFLVVRGGALEAMGVSSLIALSIDMAIEAFSGALFWMALIELARVLPIHPYRVIGVGQAVRNFIAIGLLVAMKHLSGAEGFVVPAVLLVVIAVALWLLDSSVRSTGQLQQSGGVDAAVLALASRCNLTEREAEILGLLAQGRSQRYIADKLVIAESTVKTHGRSVYRKLGVTSKQELIDLVQQTAAH